MIRNLASWMGIAAMILGFAAGGPKTRRAQAVELEQVRGAIVALQSDVGGVANAQGLSPGDAAAILRDLGIPSRTPGGLGLQPLPSESVRSAATGFRIGDGQLILSLLVPAMRQSDSLRVQPATGEAEPMTVLAWDPGSNLVVLRAADPLPDRAATQGGADGVRTDAVSAGAALPLAAQPPRWGEAVLALYAWQPGSPAIASGIVSTEQRFDAALGADAFQTDVVVPSDAIGGPVVDQAGQVVGVIAAARSLGDTPGPATVVGLDPVHRLLAYVRDGGRGPLPKPRLGVALASSAEGVTVGTAFADSPAQQAGLQAGDRIVAIEGQPVRIPEQVLAAIGARQPGDVVRVTIQRDGETQELAVTLGETPLQPAGTPGTAGPAPNARPPVGRFPENQPLTPEALRQWLEQQLGQPVNPQPPPGTFPQPPRADVPAELSDELQALSEQLRQLRQQLQEQRQNEPAGDDRGLQ